MLLDVDMVFTDRLTRILNLVRTWKVPCFGVGTCNMKNIAEIELIIDNFDYVVFPFAGDKLAGIVSTKRLPDTLVNYQRAMSPTEASDHLRSIASDSTFDSHRVRMSERWAWRSPMRNK